MMPHPARTASLVGLSLLVAATVAHGQDRLEAEKSLKLGEDLIVREVTPGIWLHVSVRPDAEGRQMPANGLLVATGKISVLIDTGWEPDQTRRLLDWAAKDLGQPVEDVIVTHAHPDRLGGLKAVEGLPIIIHGHAYTARLARLYGFAMFHWTFKGVERLNLGGEIFDLLYPGPAHAHDNIVVYLPRRKLLFGGCLITATSAKNLGYVKDANLKTWPIAVRRVIQRYREATVLIPGHGPPGGVELLSHTMELLEGAAPKAQAAP